MQCCALLRQQSLAENARKHRPHRNTQKSSKKRARVCTPPHNIMLGLRCNFYLRLHLLGHYGMESCKNTSLLAHTFLSGIVRGTMDSPYLYQLSTVAGFSTSIVWMAFIGFPQYYYLARFLWNGVSLTALYNYIFLFTIKSQKWDFQGCFGGIQHVWLRR